MNLSMDLLNEPSQTTQRKEFKSIKTACELHEVLPSIPSMGNPKGEEEDNDHELSLCEIIFLKLLKLSKTYRHLDTRNSKKKKKPI